MKSYDVGLEPFVSLIMPVGKAVDIKYSNVTAVSDASRTFLSAKGKSFNNFKSDESNEQVVLGNNGILFEDDDFYLKIYVDPFRTIPLFYSESDGLYISSDIKQCLIHAIDDEVDKVGFWELIKYGMCLGNRTIYKNVKQFSGASYLKINKNTLEYSFGNYWDYCVPEDQSINSMSEATFRLNNLLSREFKNSTSISNKYVMGISGGLDSRLSLNYLSGFVDNKNISLFTFGNYENTLEYKYSKKIAEISGCREPVFCKLGVQSYVESLSDLSVKSAGQINLVHGHIIDCLSRKNLYRDGSYQISNYFSDALFGWCCINPPEDIKVGFNRKIKNIMSDKYIPLDVKDGLIDDMKGIYKRISLKNHNYSSFDEYFYLVEKNIKLHSYLMYFQSSLTPIVSPYSSTKLIEFMMSVPIEFRQGKEIIENLLVTSSIFSDYELNNISSRDYAGATSKLSWKSFYGMKFKIINRVNIILDLMSGGKYRVKNVNHSEDLQGVYHRKFKGKMKEAVLFLVKEGILPKEVSSRFKPLRLKPADIGENLHLLSIVQAIRSLKK